METDYLITFSNGKEDIISYLNYEDTDNYDDVEAYAMSYANDEASGFLAEQGFTVSNITKLK